MATLNEVEKANEAIDDTERLMRMRAAQLRAIKLLYNTNVIEPIVVTDYLKKVMAQSDW